MKHVSGHMCLHVKRHYFSATSFMRGRWKFTSAQHTCTSLSEKCLRWDGMNFRILNSSKWAFALSTWILFCAISFVASASLCVSWPWQRNGGMLTVTPSGRIFWIKNPLLANIRFPGLKCWRTPESRTISLSLVDPGYSFAAVCDHSIWCYPRSSLKECMPR